MRYLYRQEWKEKLVTLNSVVEWTREGKYQHRIEAVRGGRTVAKTGGISLFEDMFHKPQGGDEVLLLSPTEILKKLKMDPENRANATVLGSYLRRNGFGKGDGNNRRRYKVAVNL